MNNQISESLPGDPTMPAPILTHSQQQQQQQQEQEQRKKKIKDDIRTLKKDLRCYKEKVKFKFAGEPDKYKIFYDIIRDIFREEHDTLNLVKDISMLFINDIELLLMFNIVLVFPDKALVVKLSKSGHDVFYIESRYELGRIRVRRTLLTRTIDIKSPTPKSISQPITLTTTSSEEIKPVQHLPVAHANTNAVTMNGHHSAHNCVTPIVPFNSSDPSQISLSVELDMPDRQVASNVPQVSILTTEESTNFQNQPVGMNL